MKKYNKAYLSNLFSEVKYFVKIKNPHLFMCDNFSIKYNSVSFFKKY